jgi:hypothetical protein
MLSLTICSAARNSGGGGRRMKSNTLERLRDERDELIADYIDAGVGRLVVNKVQYEAMGLRIERLNRVIAGLEESERKAT